MRWGETKGIKQGLEPSAKSLGRVWTLVRTEMKGRLERREDRYFSWRIHLDRAGKSPDLKSGESGSQLICWVTWDKLYSLSGP